MSLIDGLDTLWIMGLYTEFLDSMPIVANMSFSMETVSGSRMYHVNNIHAIVA